MSTSFHCSQCDSPLMVDILLPDEVWGQISKGDYALCAPCIDGRCVELGIKVTGIAVFRGAGLTTEITPEIQLAVAKWRLPEYFTNGHD